MGLDRFRLSEARNAEKDKMISKLPKADRRTGEAADIARQRGNQNTPHLS